jgi:GntR family transcriptional regulator
MLKPGDQLPTIRDMADEAHINFNTVARAYRVLDGAGVISTQHGRGTYAVAPPPSARARKARSQALDLLVRHVLEAAARIGSGPEELQAALARAVGRPPAADRGPRRRR